MNIFRALLTTVVIPAAWLCAATGAQALPLSYSTTFNGSVNVITGGGADTSEAVPGSDFFGNAFLAPTNPDFFDHRLGRNGLVHYSPFAPIANITGQPAISLPLHWSADGLPIGIHFMGRFGDETALLKLAAQLEKAQPWFDRQPPIR